MKKSQTKQALLSVVLGPAGLLYSSLNSALVLTLLTLFGVLIKADQTLYVLLGSFITSLIYGFLLVRTHNKQVSDRDFTLSSYIGRVSCKVIGKTRFKRDYSRPLAKAKFRRRLRSSATGVLASLCLLVTCLIALPNAISQFDSFQLGLNNIDVIASTDNSQISSQPVPLMAAAEDHQLSNIGIWQMASDETDELFRAQLQGNSYQNTGEGFYRPTLTLSCDSGHARISFAAYEVLGTENTRLTLHFDTRPEESFEWQLHGDYRSAYIAASKTLLGKLAKSNHLQISYRPFGSDENRLIDFSLGESSTVTRKLRRQCA